MKIASITDINVLKEKLEQAEATLYLTAKKAERLTEEIATRQAKLVMTRKGVEEWTHKVAEVKSRIEELETDHRAEIERQLELTAERLEQAERLAKFHA